jgi:hypothetical protein
VATNEMNFPVPTGILVADLEIITLPTDSTPPTTGMINHEVVVDLETTAVAETQLRIIMDHQLINVLDTSVVNTRSTNQRLTGAIIQRRPFLTSPPTR